MALGDGRQGSLLDEGKGVQFPRLSGEARFSQARCRGVAEPCIEAPQSMAAMEKLRRHGRFNMQAIAVLRYSKRVRGR